MSTSTEASDSGLRQASDKRKPVDSTLSEVVLHLPAKDVDPKRNHVWVAVVLATVLLAGGVLGSAWAQTTVTQLAGDMTGLAEMLDAAHHRDSKRPAPGTSSPLPLVARYSQ